MKKAKSWLILTILTTTLCFAANCNLASAQISPQTPIEILEQLPDGSLILTVDGTKFRAITPEQIRKFQKLKVEQQSALEENATLRQQNETLKAAFQKAELAAAQATEQTNLERKRADKYQQLFEGEKNLRLQADKLLTSKPPKKDSRIKKFFSRRAVQIGIIVAAGLLILKH